MGRDLFFIEVIFFCTLRFYAVGNIFWFYFINRHSLEKLHRSEFIGHNELNEWVKNRFVDKATIEEEKVFDKYFLTRALEKKINQSLNFFLNFGSLAG